MMWNIRLLQQIFSEKWFIEKGYEQQMAPLILKALLEGQQPALINEGLHVRLGQNDEGESYGWKLHVLENGKVRKVNSFAEAASNAIALLHVDGPIMRSDGWCAMGTETMGRILKGADKSPNISAIILEMNSPGGQVTGTEQLAGVIEAIETPNYTYGHFAASAAYWISAATDEIWSSGKSNQFGSIGTMASFRDYTLYLEQLGIKEIEVYATDSEHKNLPFREAKQGNFDPMREEILDPINAIFKAEVKRLRNLPEEVLSGRLYLAETAIEKGLVDRVGTRDQLVEYIYNKHGEPMQSNFSFHTNALSMDTSTSEKGQQSWLAQLTQLFPNKQALESLKLELQETATERDDWKGKYEQLQQQNTSLLAEKQELATQLQLANQQRDEWKTLAEQYGAQPGTMPSNPVKAEGDDIGEPEGFQVNQGAEHNQMAMQILSKKKGNKKL